MSTDPEIKEREGEMEHVSEQITEQSRYIGYGLVALTFAIFVSDDPVPKSLAANFDGLLWLTAICGCLTILGDYLQFLFGYISTLKALTDKEAKGRYNRTWISYRLRPLFFWAKQLFCLLGILLLLATFLLALTK